MPTVRRGALAVEVERRVREHLARLGAEIRKARSQRHLTQRQVADLAGVGRMVVSRIERGVGGVPIEALQRVALAVGHPLIITLQRDVVGETADAGHLAMQELVLGVGRRAGFHGRFELAMRVAEPWRSTDVGLIHDALRMLIVVECWNTIGDVGAAARASTRKLSEASALAAARWGELPAVTGLVWVIRSSARNRALVARYPEVFTARFPGSSARWLATLLEGTPPPNQSGLVWSDVAAKRLFAWRRGAT
jgi:transcriptional regulator with XRE-family HTH domain